MAVRSAGLIPPSREAIMAMLSSATLPSLQNKDLITSLAFNAASTVLAASSLDHHIYLYTQQSASTSQDNSKADGWLAAESFRLDAPALRVVFGINEWE